MTDELVLLHRETDLLFGLDDDDRVGRGVDLVVLVTPDGRHEILAGRTGATSVDLRHAETAAPRPPAGLTVLADALTRSDGVTRAVSGGPSYVVPVGLTVPADVEVVTSTNVVGELLSARPSVWEPDEWAGLVAGGTGAPWAFAIRDGVAVSVCHTPRRDPGAAEAGTWTDPAWRGQGLAAAITAAWSQLFDAGTALFYSTAADNTSSQAVARRLGLRFIGWMWKVAPASFVA